MSSVSVAEDLRLIDGIKADAVDKVLRAFKKMEASGMSPQDIRDALIEIIYGLSITHGEAVTGIHLNMIDTAREAAGIRDSWKATAAEAITLDEIDSRVRWSMDRMFVENLAADDEIKRLKSEGITADRTSIDVTTLDLSKYVPDIDSTTTRVESVTTQSVLYQGRATVGAASEDKKSKIVGFARVLGAKEHCSYCLMLSSRGPVYRSRETALKGNHDNCACQPLAHFKNVEYPHYDPKAIYDQWQESLKK